MCQDEDEGGNFLLTPLAGIFVSNSNKDITIKLSKLEPGWKIKGSNVKVRKGNLVVNSSLYDTDYKILSVIHGRFGLGGRVLVSIPRDDGPNSQGRSAVQGFLLLLLFKRRLCPFHG